MRREGRNPNRNIYRVLDDEHTPLEDRSVAMEGPMDEPWTVRTKAHVGVLTSTSDQGLGAQR
jgi:hypothetical protein